MIFAVDNDKIVVNILLLDAAQFPAANSRFKQHGQNSRIAYLHEIAAFAGTKHLAHICNRKRQNHGFVLFAPFEVFARVEAAVAFLIALLNECLCHPQKSIDVAALFPSLTHKAREPPHHCK